MKKKKLHDIEPMYQNIGKVISERRRKLHMTQVDLAATVKISRPSLANIEAGRQRIMLHDIFKFEEVLDLSKRLIKVARNSE